MSFTTALKEAQKAGFAEADPALDVDGIDTAHKAVILASLAYGFNVPMREVAVEGIRGLNALDLRYALELGYRIKNAGGHRAGERRRGRPCVSDTCAHGTHYFLRERCVQCRADRGRRGWRCPLLWQGAGAIQLPVQF